MHFGKLIKKRVLDFENICSDLSRYLEILWVVIILCEVLRARKWLIRLTDTVAHITRNFILICLSLVSFKETEIICLTKSETIDN